MKLNVNDDFMGVMSQKGTGHLYSCLYKNLFLGRDFDKVFLKKYKST